MTRTVKVQEAKTHLSALLAAVESAPVVTLDVRLHRRDGLRTIW